MKQFLLPLLLVFCVKINAQQKPGLPLKIADPAMDSYLQKHQTAILNIKVIHAPDTISKVPIKCTYVSFGSDFQIPKFYQFDKNGFVEIILDHCLPYQQIWLDIDHYLYAGVYVTNQLNITIDAGKIKSSDGLYMISDGVEYSGPDGELNTVMNKQILFKQDLRNKLLSDLSNLGNSRKKYSENIFFSKFDSVCNAISAIDDEFANRYPNYKRFIQNMRNADFYRSLCVAYWFDKMPDTLFKKITNFSPYFVSNEGVLFYNYLFNYIITKKDNPKINIDEELYKNYSSYSIEQRGVLDSLKYFSKLSGPEKPELLKTINKRKQEVFLNEIEKININNLLGLIDSLYTPPQSDILKTFLLAKGKNSFDQSYPEIIRSMQTGWCRNIAKTELRQETLKQKQINSLLAKGTPIKESNLNIGNPLESLPFNANLYILDSFKNIDEFIVNLKSKFPNKALIIDFWATWCAPCLKELPVSKQLHESNKDLPIEFIYICTNSGSTTTIWKKKIVELKLPGTHIFADDKLVNELKSRFDSKGSGFPTYIVIDVKGKLKPKAIQWMQYLDRDNLKSAVGL